MASIFLSFWEIEYKFFGIYGQIIEFFQDWHGSRNSGKDCVVLVMFFQIGSVILAGSGGVVWGKVNESIDDLLFIV